MAIEKKIVVGVDTSDGQQNIEKLSQTVNDLNQENIKLKQSVKDLNNEYKKSKGDVDAQTEANKKLVLAQTELYTNNVKLKDAKKELNNLVKQEVSGANDLKNAVNTASMSLGEMRKEMAILKNTSFTGKSEEEVKANPRARSAKLRVIEKI